MTIPLTVIVLPAYNEGKCIDYLLGEISRVMTVSSLEYRIVLVDDGCNDNTVAVALSSGVPFELVRHETNMGLGVALRDGFETALNLTDENDVIITMDADDTQPPEVIPQMLEKIQSGCDVVIASRFQTGARTLGVPVVRRILSTVASWLFRLLAPAKGVRDYTCGFRAYRTAIIHKAFRVYQSRLFDRSGFECMVDLILKLNAVDATFGEVPFTLRYDVKQGRTKMHVLKTVRNTLRVLLRAFWARFSQRQLHRRQEST